MKRIAIAAILWTISMAGYALPPSVAFYYQNNPPVHELQLFNTVVVEPSYVPHPKQYETKRSHWYAYVSVGEVSKKRNYFKQIKRHWILGHNKTWNSKVLDQSNPQWRHFFVHVVLKKLWAQGYRGFFLDTMDSYHLVAKSKKSIAQQTQGLVNLIKSIRKQYPEAKLILNRGFELLPSIHQAIQGITAESLYLGYDFKKKKYRPVSQSDRDWLIPQLKKAKTYGLDVYIIDYLPTNQQKKARADAKRISQAGYIPWVSDTSLFHMGVSSLHVIPREVMLLYSSKQETERIIASPLQYLAMPLNYLGYVPKLYDVEIPLPLTEHVSANRIAGVVIWLDSTPFKREPHMLIWLKEILKKKIPVAIISSLAYYKKDKALLKQLGLSLPVSKDLGNTFSFSIMNKSMLGYETQPRISIKDFYPLIAKSSTVLVQVKNSNGQTEDTSAITPWGGYAVAPYVIDILPNHQSRYVMNPFLFLKKALRLESIPIPDVTTENGRRILITHIDGDGFYSRSEWPRGPFAGESLLKTILQKYKIPTTVSIIEGEIGKSGLKPKDSPKLERLARETFKLPWVEIANHSYSHPFFWRKAYANTGKIIAGDSVERLNIPNYKFSLKREIIDSTRYINEQLAPPGKKCKIFLWTGDTDPPDPAVGMAYKIGLLNMNNGNTTISKDYDSLAAVTGMGIYKGKYLQVFAPIQNENIYTNDWLGPYYGFKRVIESFKMTNLPRRLKPINIYYHFYSASKVSALNALDFVYDWSLKQAVIPEFSSSYIRKAMDYYTMTIGKSEDTWLIHGDGNIREFRSPGMHSYPTLNSKVIGYNSFNDSHYIHTTKSDYAELRLQSTPPKHIYLHDSNALLIHYKKKGSAYYWRLKSYIPLIANFSNARHCQFKINGKAAKSISNKELSLIKRDRGGEVELQAQC